jgi:small nuclear ribonucleoprotein G
VNDLSSRLKQREAWGCAGALCKRADLPSLFRCLAVTLNANRHVSGTLRGFDQFMNVVLDQTVDEKLKVDIGMVVIRGNSIQTIEALETIN